MNESMELFIPFRKESGKDLVVLPDQTASNIAHSELIIFIQSPTESEFDFFFIQQSSSC